MDFDEGKLEFNPTYKYTKGTATYVHMGKGGSSKRDPAWCDRVLFRGDVELKAYNAYMNISQSDHKPVYAEFHLKVKDNLGKTMQPR